MDRAGLLLEERLDAADAEALAESVVHGRLSGRRAQTALAELACRVLVDEADAAGRPARRRAARVLGAALWWAIPLAFALRVAQMAGAFG